MAALLDRHTLRHFSALAFIWVLLVLGACEISNLQNEPSESSSLKFSVIARDRSAR
ncbi:hypothetical protein KR51_00012480 [Rubidibacter lacunae KORDI 51-2]|uniref:Uncharacterized protein n=1 Tax=Rubidibacter lacunae KORDI 51-2 TaxID=582515 RepID=U5DNC7_9CHRO|nr:hypothetical protein [Rubidibacter lacunae]ERN42094.1 hypothetical protein KR51_00012480 [Rubidibacter lacunae KORDI 51-2]